MPVTSNMNGDDFNTLVLSLAPSFATFAGMILFLSFSFIVYRRKRNKGKELQRELQHEYEILQLSTRRPRVGVLTGFAHDEAVNDMIQSLSGSDISQLLRYYNVGVDRNRHLESVPEEKFSHARHGKRGQVKINQPAPTKNPPTEGDTSDEDRYLYYDELGIIPDEEFECNAYYEENGIHPSPRKPKTRPKQETNKQQPKNKIKLTFGVELDQNNDVQRREKSKELTNRISNGKQISNKALPVLDEVFWQNEISQSSEKNQKKRINSLFLRDTDSRSLAHHFEYDNIIEDDVRRSQRRILEIKSEHARDRSSSPTTFYRKKRYQGYRGKKLKKKRNNKTPRGLGNNAPEKIIRLDPEDIQQSAV